jgi:hypothetical protein
VLPAATQACNKNSDQTKDNSSTLVKFAPPGDSSGSGSGPGDRRGGPGGPGGRFGFPKPGQILPDFMQDQLKLTDDQKKKLADLQKDVDDKLDKLLTDDQRKQLKEMMDRGPGGRRGPGGPGGDGGPGGGRRGPGGPGGPGGSPPPPPER